MKHILSAILLSVTVGLTFAQNISDTPQAVARSAETCGDPALALPFYRIFAASTSEYFWSANVAVITNGIRVGYVLESVAAMVFVTQEESTVPFYRLPNGALEDVLWTISTTERDNAIASGRGYSLDTADQTHIYPTQICGSVPLYRIYNSVTIKNSYTTSESERLDFIANHGYSDMGIAGYVLPAGVAQCDC